MLTGLADYHQGLSANLTKITPWRSLPIANNKGGEGVCTRVRPPSKWTRKLPQIPPFPRFVEKRGQVFVGTQLIRWDLRLKDRAGLEADHRFRPANSVCLPVSRWCSRLVTKWISSHRLADAAAGRPHIGRPARPGPAGDWWAAAPCCLRLAGLSIGHAL